MVIGLKFSCEEEHRVFVLERLNSVITKRDKVFLLGDVIFKPELVYELGNLNGASIEIIGGNHDVDLRLYSSNRITACHGIRSYKGMWLSHAPIHPVELRRKPYNVHGHVHYETVPDPRYINACLEVNNFLPLSLDEIRERINFNKEILCSQ